MDTEKTLKRAKQREEAKRRAQAKKRFEKKGKPRPQDFASFDEYLKALASYQCVEGAPIY